MVTTFKDGTTTKDRNGSKAVFSGRYTDNGKPIYVASRTLTRKQRESAKRKQKLGVRVVSPKLIRANKQPVSYINPDTGQPVSYVDLKTGKPATPITPSPVKATITPSKDERFNNMKVGDKIESRLSPGFVIQKTKKGVIKYKGDTGTFGERVAKGQIAAETRLEAYKNRIFKALNVEQKYSTWNDLTSKGPIEGTKRGVAMTLRYLGRLPIEISTIPFVVGGRIATVAAATYDKLSPKSQAILKANNQRSVNILKEVVSTGKQVPSAVLQMYDVRRPEGVLNVLLTGAMVRGLAKSKMNRIAFEKEISNSKVKAKVKIKEVSPTEVRVTRKGIIKTSKREIPFKEEQILKKKDLISGKYDITSTAKYKVPEKGLFGKIKVKTRTVKSKAKGIQVESTPKKSLTLEKPAFKDIVNAYSIKNYQGWKKPQVINKYLDQRVIDLATIKTLGKTSKFTQVIKGTKAKGKLFTKKATIQVNSVISKIKRGKTITTFELTQSFKRLPAPTLKAKIRIMARQIVNAYKKATGSKARAVIKGNLTRLGEAFKKLKQSKKGQLAIGRSRGSFIDEQIGRGLSKSESSSIEAILKRADKALKFKSGKKAIPKAKKTITKSAKPITSKAAEVKAIRIGKIKSQSVGLTPIINALQPKIMILPLVYSMNNAKNIAKIIGKDLGLNINQVVAVSSPKTQPVTEPTPETIPTSSSRTKPVSEPQATSTAKSDYLYKATPAHNTFFVNNPAPISNILLPPLIPILPFMLGGPSGKGTSQYFRRFFPTAQSRFGYIPDLKSLVYGIKASKNQIDALLNPRRVFSGAEARPIV